MSLIRWTACSCLILGSLGANLACSGVGDSTITASAPTISDFSTPQSLVNILGEVVSTIFVRQCEARHRRAGWLDLTVRPFWKFFRAYVIKLGFLDGWPGYFIAWVNAFSTVARYAKVIESSQQIAVPQSDTNKGLYQKGQ